VKKILDNLNDTHLAHSVEYNPVEFVTEHPLVVRSSASVALIIPAYNEAGRVGAVVEAVCGVKILDEIILIDDGSTDGTGKEAEEIAHFDTRFRVFRHSKNVGKGQSIFHGWQISKSQIIAILDADLKNLHPDHIEALIMPVVNDEVDMTVGVFKGGYWRADMAHWLTPWLSGQRCLRSHLMHKVSPDAAKGYGIETAITIAAHQNNWRFKRVPLIGVTHPLGEIPRGGYHGWKTKMVMFYQIGRAWFLTRERGKTVKWLMNIGRSG
jgi:glycosyltransferase involved in cell wall biosynthesis